MFLNIIFPQDLIPYFTKNISYSTNVESVQSGIEYRRLITPESRIVYKLHTAIKQRETVKILTDFFHITSGKTHSFKLYDLTDCSIEQCPALPINSNTVQIQKIITEGNKIYRQNITKPKENSIHVYNNKNEITKDSTVDYEKGQITFNQDISVQNVSISCSYFQHVRFNTDSISLKMKNDNAIEVNDIEIITVIN